MKKKTKARYSSLRLQWHFRQPKSQLA